MLPAVRLAHALMQTVSERLSSQRVAEGVRAAVALIQSEVAAPNAAPPVDPGSSSSAVSGEDPIQSPSVDVMGALLEHAGGWRGACVLERVSSSWQLAVRGWRQYEQYVNLVDSDDGAAPRRYGFAAVLAVSRACPNLVEIAILGHRDGGGFQPARVTAINDLACELLVNGCPRLRCLRLRDCGALTSDCLRSIGRLSALETLDLAGCDGIFTAGGGEGSSTTSRSAAVVTCVTAMPTLSRLVLYGCAALADADESVLVGQQVLERASCGCNHCVGFASAQLRLRLALMAAQSAGLDQTLAI